MGINHVENFDYKLLFESAPNLYLVLNQDFKIVTASESYLQATMVNRDEIQGRHLFEVFPDNPEDPSATGTAQLRASLERVLGNRTSDVMAIQKYDVRRPDSEGGGFEERYWCPLNSPVFDSTGNIKYIIHRVEDVTDFVKLKRQGLEQFRITQEIRTEKDQLEKLRQSQRLEAMGALAGGVAHDFNNILAVILLTCENVLIQTQLEPPVKKQLNQIISSAEKAATLTRQLLAFSRQQVLQPKILNLNSVLRNIQDLLSRLLKENIEFKVILEEEIKNILVDQGQIEQVLLNLVVNARDAMPFGGKITVETSNVFLDKTMTSGNMSVESGMYVMLTVRDTGVGMDAKTQARIFEPFFTTKAIGEGTGLGLATVYGIVNQNKGSIWVYSEINKGTVFKIYFPQIEDQSTEVVSTAKLAEQDLSGSETLLVVEDQEPLRNMISTILESKGYVVYKAKHGNEALDILKRINYAVDLIISDVIMPEMGGQELAKQLNILGYKIKFLYLSGFAGDILTNENSVDSSLHFIEKPFSHIALIGKVKLVMQTLKD